MKIKSVFHTIVADGGSGIICERTKFGPREKIYFEDF